MSESINIFNFDQAGNFEELGVPNGIRTWKESDMMQAFEYQSKESFRKVITRAMQACLTLQIPTEDAFVRDENNEYKLTRFACYLIAMNADTKKQNVAAAQIYFATLAETFNNHIQHADQMERVLTRDELKEGMKSLASTAKKHEVAYFAHFQNAGYRGLYNMDLAALTKFKGIKQKELLFDRIGRTELAANLFRVTQTEEKIKNENLRGQNQLERAAEQVGRTVRKAMIETSGVAPEHLPIQEHIREVKKKIKSTHNKFKKIDGKKKETKKIKKQGESG